MGEWQKRTAITLPCPSGADCDVRRPSPELSLKAGRLTHVFAVLDAPAGGGELSDQDAAKTYLFARQVVLECVVRPELSDEPSDEKLTPEDIPPKDFWHVFKWAITGGKGMPVAMKEGETTVEAVETFPDESPAIDILGSNSEQVSQVAV